MQGIRKVTSLSDKQGVADWRNLTSGTNVVKETSGFLRRLVINKGFTGTITIYDNTAASGDKIATITDPAVGQNFNFFCDFNTGLTVVLSTTGDVTVSFA